MAIRYWETLFDSRFMWDNEWKQRRDIVETQDQVVAVEQQSLQREAQLQAQVHDLSITVMALVELLADAKQIDPQELRARVQAAVIGERNEKRAASPLDQQQGVWDGAGPKK